MMMTQCLALFFVVTCLAQTALDDRAVKLAERALPAIVTIEVLTPEGESKGTGFLVDPSGTVVTCLHVVKGASKASAVLTNGERYEVRQIRTYDERRDIVVLKIPAFDLPAIPLGNSNNVKPGQSVLLFGSNLGLEGSVTGGVISGIRNLPQGIRLIQTDAPANRGNSGGPLINTEGEVIGVVGSKMVGADVEGVAFALPINYVRGLLQMPDDNLELTALSGALATTGGDPDECASCVDRLTDVKTIYVDTFGNREAAILVREKAINRIHSETPLHPVGDLSRADAILTGFVGMDADGKANAAVVRLIGKKGMILWTAETNARGGGSASSSVANGLIKRLAKALAR